MTLAGTVHLEADPVLGAGTLNLGNSFIYAGGRTIDGASLVGLTSSGAVFHVDGDPVTLNNLSACVGTILARNWTGTGNEAAVQTLARPWLD